MTKTLRALGVGLLVAGPSLANSLAVTAPGLNGTSNKLAVNCAGASNTNVSVSSEHPNGETHYRAEWLMTPATLELAQNKAIQFGAVFTSENGQALLLKLKKNDNNNTWEIKVRYKVDSNNVPLPTYAAMPNLFLTTEAAKATTRKIVMEWQSATGENTNDGFLKFTKSNIDGTNVATSEIALNTNETIEEIRFGILRQSGLNCDAAGTYHFDEFASFR